MSTAPEVSSRPLTEAEALDRIDRVFRCEALRMEEKLVLIAVITAATGDDLYPGGRELSVEGLAVWTRLDAEQVRRAVAKLEAEGEVLADGQRGVALRPIGSLV